MSDNIEKELERINSLNLELINSLADEKALNLNLDQTVKILEILRHKQDAKLEKITEFIESDKFDDLCAEFGKFDYTKPLKNLKEKFKEILNDQ